ncbi:MAG: long-chain fatty acid--CoA ligase, partial [Candidatus Eremiobacteraeota bacterium]|nr:long-chain fatty acid--CoA ligase [Candidatus Eremiobacteraeota bacterium]
AGDELRFGAATATLQAATRPTLIFGTAFALVHFMDRCAAQGLRFALPADSRVVETGGFKGKSRAVEPVEFYAALSRTFGVPREFCISEYGMCELGSQWYDANLADVLAGRRPRLELKVGPHWARELIMDPVSGEPSGAAEGLLGLFDLCNRGSVMAVLSTDRARAAEGGFVFLGRATGAPPKGCSMTIDALLSARHA